MGQNKLGCNTSKPPWSSNSKSRKNSDMYQIEPTVDPFFFMVSTPLKNMKASWDDVSIYYGKIIQMFQTTNQFSKLIFHIFSIYFPYICSINRRYPIYFPRIGMLAVLRELRQRLHHDGDHLEPEPRPTVIGSMVLVQCGAPVMWMLVDKPQEYYSYLRIINHSYW